MTRWRRAALIGLPAALVVAAVFWLAAGPEHPDPGSDARRAARPAPVGAMTRMLAGIELSAVQRTRVRMIQAKYADELREVGRRLRPVIHELNQARYRQDTAAVGRLWAQSEPDRARGAELRTRMRAEIREVLTPEQRPRFDANTRALDQQSADLDRRLSSPPAGPAPTGRAPDSSP
jgi:Spy/CpxP family protein refolding chaperone